MYFQHDAIGSEKSAQPDSNEDAIRMEAKKDKSRESRHVGLISPIMKEANREPFKNMVSIAESLFQPITIIQTCGHGMRPIQSENEFVVNITHGARSRRTLARVLAYVTTQLRVSMHVSRCSQEVDLWIFYLSSSFVLPIIAAKLARKECILVVGGSAKSMLRGQKLSVDRVEALLESVGLLLSDKIVTYSSRLIDEWNMTRFDDKTFVASEHIIDIDKFRIVTDYSERQDVIGFVGRLSPEKGILDFLNSIPYVLQKRPGIVFLIGGDGELRPTVESFLKKNRLESKVDFRGWIPHEELPATLNRLKLLVLPSRSEGLPNIILESMACGTLVLTTPVGAIPDIVQDSSTGFIMNDNSATTIGEEVLRILNCPEPERITTNARALITAEFTREKAIKKWQAVVHHVGERRR